MKIRWWQLVIVYIVVAFEMVILGFWKIAEAVNETLRC